MNWILEDPLYVVVLGIIATIVFGFGFLQTNFRPLAYAAGGAVILTVILVYVERVVVTDFEELEAALHEMAHDAENNDLAAILDHIHPSARAVRQRAEREFPLYEFSRVDIKRNLKIQFVDDGHRRATASFNVVVEGTFRQYEQFGKAAEFVELELRKDDDRWQVTDYHHFPPQHGLIRRIQ
jgi:hypothetical protein